MIINRVGATFTHEGVTYTIGGDCDTVVTTENSALVAGLVGKITEIRTDADKETGNEWPDFYCTFHPPQNPELMAELNHRCGGIYGKDYGLEDVIMAPDELDIVTYSAIEKSAMDGNAKAKSFTDKFIAVAHADKHGWEYVINSVTGEVLWIKGRGWVEEEVA